MENQLASQDGSIKDFLEKIAALEEEIRKVSLQGVICLLSHHKMLW